MGPVGASGGVNEIAVLGRAANLNGAERRELTLKRISEPVGVRVVKHLARADQASSTISDRIIPLQTEHDLYQL